MTLVKSVIARAASAKMVVFATFEETLGVVCPGVSPRSSLLMVVVNGRKK